MLEVRGATAAYGALPVLHGVDVDVDDGEVVALIGANGAGKSTLLRVIAGLHRATGGQVRFRGSDVATTSASRVARSGLRLVPSDRRLFPDLSVHENLLLGAHPRRPSAGELRRVTELFPRLAERWGQRVGTLSGGEQQMVAVGRALLGRPRLLVLDEPTAGLAPRLVDEVYRALTILREETGLAVLVAEQQLPRVLALADRGVVLDHGRVVRSDASAVLRADAQIQRTYLGVDR